MAIVAPFSDVEWIRRDLPSITEEDMRDDDVLKAIEDGDLCVKDDLSGMVDWTTLSTLPEAIRRLSHYKACELVVLRVISNAAVITQENALVTYWSTQYENLKKNIYTGKVRLISSTGTALDEEGEGVTRTYPPIGRVI